MDKYASLPRKYNKSFIKYANKEYNHSATGVKHNTLYDTFRIGKEEIIFDHNDIIIITTRYKGSERLYDLLFKKEPKNYTEKDLSNYKNILKETIAHRRGYDSDRQLASSSSFKWRTIISLLFRKNDNLEGDISFTQPYNETSGEETDYVIGYESDGFGMQMEYSNKNIELIYWNSMNKLVQRLKLLLASQQAGNNNLNNKIISIIEELREAGVIK